jgi:hypothetical protein
MDWKRRIFRLIEVYLNEFKGCAVEEMYGKGTKIKIHSISDSIKDKSLLIEAVIVLGDTINEEVMDRELADVLIQDALVYFYPEYSIKTMVRWDA